MSSRQSSCTFSTPEEALEQVNNRTAWEKCSDSLVSWKNLLRHGGYKVSNRLSSAAEESSVTKAHESLPEVKEMRENYHGIIIGLHGLNDNISQFETIVKKLYEKGVTTPIYLHEIQDRGNAMLDDMSEAVIDKLKHMLGDDPASWDGSHPITIIGISNGCRIGQEVTRKILESNTSIKVILVGIVGAGGGSTLVDWVKEQRLLSSFLPSPEIAEEMGARSQRTKKAKEDWRKLVETMDTAERLQMMFIGAQNDWLIGDTLGSLPEKGKASAEYHITTTHGHNSASWGVADVATKYITKLLGPQTVINQEFADALGTPQGTDCDVSGYFAGF